MRCFLLALLVTVPSGPEEWKAGLAAAKITPQEPLQLSGYAARKKPSEGVAADLYAKALALEDSEGNRALLLTLDLIGFRAAVADPVCERIAGKTGLKRAHILLNFSHTHSAPQLSADPDPQTEDARKTAAYTKQVQDRLVELAAEALGRLEPARLSWGTGVANLVMNRREFTPRGVILGVNPRGPADRCVPVLRVSDPEGKLRAVLFGCACHGTTLTQNNYLVCGDYAGFAQVLVQERLPGVQAMFMIGCGGDANPYPRGTLDLAREHGAALGAEVCRVLEGKLQPVRGPLRTEFDRAELPFQQFSREELEKLASKGPGHQQGVARQLLALLEKGEKPPAHYPAPVAVWQFGQDLTLVGLSGEVVVDYAILLERALGPLRLWVSAYCNEVFGYLPSARVLEEGGYETRGVYYGPPGLFSPAAQDAAVRKVRELAEKAGRQGMK